MKKFITLTLLLIFMLSLASCGGDSVEDIPTDKAMTETANEYGITRKNFPKIDGSTSSFNIIWGIYESMCKDTGDVTDFPRQPMKTVPSYENLISKELDLIIVPKASKAIMEKAKSEGVELEFTPIAAEALVFITPKENTTENITKKQLRKIYIDYGIKNWSELGGPDKELAPICRNSDSGSQGLMDTLVLNNEEMDPEIQNNYIETTMEGMLYIVVSYHHEGFTGTPANNAYALGYTLYTYLDHENQMTGVAESLKMLSYNGVEPTEENIISGEYGLSDPYYAVVRKDLPKDHSARRIVEWLKSENGADMIVYQGFLPLDKY